MRRINLSCLALPCVLLGLTLPTAAQNVSITLTPHNPPIVIPATGGSFEFDMTLHNGEATPQTIDIWTVISGPVTRPGWGPYLGLTMSPGATITRTRTQVISDRYPAGAYTYTGNIGDHPSVIWNSDSFPFEKLAPGGTELWVARYNGPGNNVDYAFSLALDAAGKVYVTGGSYGGGTGMDYATIKYDTDGSRIWAARYNGPGNGSDIAYDLTVDGSGNVYVTGFSDGGATSYDYATVKYDTSGAEQWVARYNGPGNGGDQAYSLAVDDSGNVYVTGFSHGSGTNSDYATIKYNAAGEQQWVARYNGSSSFSDWASSLALDGAGNVYVTGSSMVGFEMRLDYVTIKYDAAGAEQWVACYDGPGNGDDDAYSLAVDGNGSVYVTGYSFGGGGTWFDYATVKYDSAGAEQWVARYNGPGIGADEAHSLAVDGGGNVYVTGRSYGSGTSFDYTTVKYDPSGNQVWVARYNGPGNDLDEANSLAVDNSGNVYVTGISLGSGTNYDCATIKYDSSGHQIWAALYSGPWNDWDNAPSLAVDVGGNVYVTGSNYYSETFYDYLTIKYSGGNIDNWMPAEATVLGQSLPQECRLEQNFPNPFNASTVLRYKMQDARYVSLKVYDTAGRLVETLVDGWRSAGEHELTFDASDLPSGMYIYRIQAGHWTDSGKMILLK